ncbi:MAG: glycosyl transferase [Rhodospirillales bacterium RIFCSPLOWO2_12_FULL_58_28]|nr:MAG: glycosyl transferase [Rhodospirillales bacterium RIFCSPLOWO2_02_FULL_58_16]OHC79241.1 MAG: glycosyl transferase [Rhodospirillales bacterium RIFCSPLOWO2_12_FULL_58_28]
MDETSDSAIVAPAEKPQVIGGAERFATVLQVLPALGAGGGVERGAVEIAAAISAAGGRALVASGGGIMVHDLKRARAEHFTLPVDSKNPLVMFANIGRLTRLIKDQGVDIVHARSRAPAWSSYFAAKRAGVHFVTTFHGTYSCGNRLKRYYNSIMTRGERVIAISSFIAGHIRQIYGVPTSKIRIIHRGVDLNSFDSAKINPERVVALAARWRLGDGMPVVMLPGRLTRWKGQTVLIEAVAKLKSRNLRCILVGSDQGRKAYRHELENLVSKYNLGEVVRFVDHCTDMPAAYMLCDVVVSASIEPEAFGRVAPEAQALGRPVIATDHGGARETIINGETGWLIPPGDADALAAALAHVLEIKEPARKNLAEKAIANVRENFSRSAMCAGTLEVYNEILHLKAGGE